MKRILIALFAIASIPALAEVDPVAQERLDSIKYGKNNGDVIQTLRVKDALILPAGSVETADLAAGVVSTPKLADGAVSGDKLAGLTVTSKTLVTNGQVFAISFGEVNYVESSGGVENGTNTITLVTDCSASDVGKPTYLVNHFYATNHLAIDIDGNLYGGGNIDLADGDAVLFIPLATNILYLIDDK